MKKKILLLIMMAVIVIVAFVMIPANITIEKMVPVLVFNKDAVTTDSVVEISGKIQGCRWSENKTFVGDFRVHHYEKLCRDGIQAKIEWDDNTDYQSILFFNQGDFVSLGVEQIIINSEMSEFALEFDDGNVIATSHEMYQKIRSGGQ